MIWIIAAAAAWGIVVAAGGAVMTELSPWYYTLKKPSWQPPEWLFGPAWTVILSLTSIAIYLGWSGAPGSGSRTLIVAVSIVNAVANLAWSPLFFKLRRPDWALLEVPLLWLSIVAMMAALAPVSLVATLLLLPYLAWVSFASVLNLTIVRLNRPFGR